MENDFNIELRSQEVQEIMGRIPSMIERIGITILFVFVIAALCFCALAKYPEHLEVKTSNFTFEKNETRKDTINVTYLLNVGLEEKEKIRKDMDVSIKLGKEDLHGKISFISSKFNYHTGLFHVYASFWIDNAKIPLILQYKETTTVNINIANKSILQKIFER